MRDVVSSLTITSCRAESDIEGGIREQLVAHVGINIVAVLGSVDGGVIEVVYWAIVGDGGDLVGDIAVGTGDHDVEFVAPLAVIDCASWSECAAPVRALYIGEGWRILTS